MKPGSSRVLELSNSSDLRTLATFSECGVRTSEKFPGVLRTCYLANSPLASAVIACLSTLTFWPARATAQAVTQLCIPIITRPTTVVTAAQRKEAGAKAQPPITDHQNGFAWPDSEIGVFKSNAGYEFFASDGAHHGGKFGNNKYGSVTCTMGTLDNPLGSTPPIDVVIHPNANRSVDPHHGSYTYLGGGRVYLVPAGLTGASNLLLVYHAEINTITSFYSLLGLAESLDDGMSWTDLGEIIRLNQPYKKSLDGFDIGSPQLVTSMDGNYFYIYFQDWIRHSPTRHLTQPHLKSIIRAHGVNLALAVCRPI